MRYKLDANGYISAVAFGSYLDNCTEYTGIVPIGYNSLNDWATYSCIQAYYIDTNGNLALDIERLAECRRREAQEKIDNTPVLRKDIYGSESVLEDQYVRDTKTGEVITLEDIMRISPKVKITNVTGLTSLNLYIQGKNMMPCNAVSKTIGGVTFTQSAKNGPITIKGTATEDIEYSVAGSESNTTPLFVLKKDHYYYTNFGGLQYEMKYFNGETTAQQFAGTISAIKPSVSIEVTEVVIKIPKGKTINATITPRLFYGTTHSSFGVYKGETINIDLGEVNGETIDYVLIENGTVSAYVNGEQIIICGGSVRLYGDYNTIYTLQDTELEVEYSTTEQVIADGVTSDTIKNWCHENDKAYIDGGKIYAHSVTANEIDVDDLFAQEINATGSITANADSDADGKFVVEGVNGYKTIMSMGGIKTYGFGGHLYVQMDASQGMVTIFDPSTGYPITFMHPQGFVTDGDIEAGGSLYVGGNKVSDFVVAEGTSGIWKYRKWNSGLAECWARISKTFTASDWASWGSNFYCGSSMTSGSTPVYPFTFTAIPREIVTLRGATGAQMWMSVGGSNTVSKMSSEYYPVRSTKPSASITAQADVYVVGMWK